MPLGRLVPWSSWDEWQRVREGLFSTDNVQLRRALDQVSAWEARGKSPLGADMTAVMQRIRLRDPGHTNPVQQACRVLSAEQESMLRMQYALAIVRLVNGISDSAQKGTVAKSVANLAETVGLPRILVDIRHEASHNELPSLALLRLGAASALAWLSQSYWQQQADHLTLRKSQIHELLQDRDALEYMQKYVESQKNCLGLSQCPGAAGGQTHGDEEGNGSAHQQEAGSSAVEGQKLRRELLSQLLSKVQSNAASLVDPLFDEGLLDAAAACSQSSSAEAAAAATLWQATMQDLSAVWPSLPQRLLARAVRRIAGAPQCLKTQAWIQCLLNGPSLGKEQALEDPSHKRKKRKEAAAKADQDLGTTPLWLPSKQLLKSSLSTCIQASARTTGKGTSEGAPSPSALHSSVDIILGKLRSMNGDPSPASRASEHLQALAKLASTVEPPAKSGSSLNKRGDGDLMVAAAAPSTVLSKAAPSLREATAGQHLLMQQHKLSPEPDSQRRSGWQVAESWAPCAIGMVPSADSPTGRAPSTTLVLPDRVTSEQQHRCSAMQESSHSGPEAQVACASEARPLQGDAEDHVLEHASAARMSMRHMERSEGIKREDCYFSRFQGVQNAQAETTQSDSFTPEHCKHDGMQDQHGMRHQQLVLPKPVRLL